MTTADILARLTLPAGERALRRVLAGEPLEGPVDWGDLRSRLLARRREGDAAAGELLAVLDHPQVPAGVRDGMVESYLLLGRRSTFELAAGQLSEVLGHRRVSARAKAELVRFAWANLVAEPMLGAAYRHRVAEHRSRVVRGAVEGSGDRTSRIALDLVSRDQQNRFPGERFVAAVTGLLAAQTDAVLELLWVLVDDARGAGEPLEPDDLAAHLAHAHDVLG